jgi:Secretion system C-terminal sorting domain
MKSIFLILLSFLFVAFLGKSQNSKQKSYVLDQQEVMLKDSTFEFRNAEDDTDNLFHKVINEYNEKGQLIASYSTYIYNGVTTLGRSFFQYDSFGNLIEDISEYYDSEWLAWEKFTYQYNSDNLQIGSVSYINDEGGEPLWNKYSKTESNYNADKKIASHTNYFWDVDVNNWTQSTNEQYYYLNRTLLKTYRFNIWDEEELEFVFNRRTVHNYNEDNIRLSSDGFYWDDDSREWIQNSESLYTYENNLLTAQVNKYYSTETEEWNPRWKYTFDYDTNGLLIADSSYFFDSYYEVWGYRQRKQHFFSMHLIEVEVISTPKLEMSNLLVFPNPTSGYIQLLNSELYDVKLINVYNEQGQMVIKQNFKTEVDLSSVSCGNYFLEIIGKNGRKITKVIKKR